MANSYIIFYRVAILVFVGCLVIFFREPAYLWLLLLLLFARGQKPPQRLVQERLESIEDALHYYAQRDRRKDETDKV